MTLIWRIIQYNVNFGNYIEPNTLEREREVAKLKLQLQPSHSSIQLEYRQEVMNT